MWNRIRYRLIRLFTRRKNMAARLNDTAHAQALADARLLFAQGTRVRELLPGEVTDGEPEIGKEPL